MTTKLSFPLGALALAFSLVGCAGNASIEPTDHQEMAAQDESRGTQKVTIRTPNPDLVVAFQDGAGEWKMLEAAGPQLFRGIVKDPQGRYGVAVIKPFTTQADVYQLTTGEAVALDFRRPEPATLRRVVGNVTGWNPATQFLRLNGGVANQTPYEVKIHPPSSLAALTGAKSEYDSETDPLGPMKYFLQRGLTGNARINLNLNSASFQPMQTYSLDTSSLSAPVTGASFSMLVDGNAGIPLPIRRQANSQSFASIPFDQYTANDALTVALGTWNAGVNRLCYYRVYQPTATLPVIDFAPVVSANIVSDPSGWKVNFTTDPSYQFYRMFVSGARSALVRVSQGWCTANGTTSYSNPTQLGTLQPFKKAFAGIKDRLQFEAISSAQPIAAAMQDITFYFGAAQTPSTAGPHLLGRSMQVSDSI